MFVLRFTIVFSTVLQVIIPSHGEMVLSSRQMQIIKDTESGLLRSVATDLSIDLRWPNNEIPFVVVSDNMSRRQIELLEIALSNVNKKCCGCVKFRHATPKDRHILKIVHDKSNRCNSYVGFQNQTVQIITIAYDSCYNHADISHELLHGVGLFHEHNRLDRDDYIEIHENCIKTDKISQFKKTPLASTFGSYDPASIMHYASGDQSRGDCPSFQSRIQNGVEIYNIQIFGSNKDIGKLDVAKIAHLYRCDGTKIKEENCCGRCLYDRDCRFPQRCLEGTCVLDKNVRWKCPENVVITDFWKQCTKAYRENDIDAAPGNGLCPEESVEFKCPSKFVRNLDSDCSRVYNCTITKEGLPCVIPFKIKLLGSVKNYSNCTSDVFDRSWCPLKVDSDGFVDLFDKNNIQLCHQECSNKNPITTSTIPTSKTATKNQKESISILVVGGYDDNSRLNSVEVIGDKTCSLPQLPFGITWQPSIILTNDNEILACGGYKDNIKQCLVLKEQKWEKHSDLNKERYHASAVTMPNGVYIFGGGSSKTTSEFLPNGSTTWQPGPVIPDGHKDGCSVKILDLEILLIGGYDTKKRLIKLNTETNEWTTLGELQEGRCAHACAVMKGKVIVSGGKKFYTEHLTSTEVISLENPISSRTVGHLNEARRYHGLGIAHMNNEPTLLAFGGIHYQNDVLNIRHSIERWNQDNETWTLATDMKLRENKYSFGFLSVPSHLICN